MAIFNIARTYFRIALQNELQYRANFFVQVFTSFLELGTGIAEIAIIFQHTDTLGGWRAAELRALMGVFFIVGGAIQMLIRPSMQRLMDDVRQGTLDFALTKPEDAQTLVSLRQFEIWKAADVLLGVAVLTQALWSLRADVSATRLGLFLAMLACGLMVVYSFWLMLATCTFWLVKMDNILFIFQGMYDAGRWPLSLYPNWLRALLTFLVPVAFAVTVPAEALVGRLNVTMMVAAFALAAAMLVVSRAFWRYGIRHYSGASA